MLAASSASAGDVWPGSASAKAPLAAISSGLGGLGYGTEQGGSSQFSQSVFEVISQTLK